jgi:hypothetical protein
MSASVASHLAADFDNDSIVTAGQPNRQPVPATPEDEVALARAEVAAMEGAAPARRADRAAEEALMGAAPAEDGVLGFEVTDESGELVKQRFVQFLGQL